ncbi:MAG: transposase [Pseudanabaena sp. ELA645]|jgi:transposase
MYLLYVDESGTTHDPNQQYFVLAVFERQAYNLKEEFKNIFETCKTPEDGQEKLKAWLEKAKPVYGAVLETIRNHLDNICNYFLNRTSNGVMEGLNNRIKLIKRQAYGFLNFIYFRSRLLACLSH